MEYQFPKESVFVLSSSLINFKKKPPLYTFPPQTFCSFCVSLGLNNSLCVHPGPDRPTTLWKLIGSKQRIKNEKKRKVLPHAFFLPHTGKRRRAYGTRYGQTMSERCRRQRRSCESHVRSCRRRFRQRRTK